MTSVFTARSGFGLLLAHAPSLTEENQNRPTREIGAGRDANRASYIRVGEVGTKSAKPDLSLLQQEVLRALNPPCVGAPLPAQPRPRVGSSGGLEPVRGLATPESSATTRKRKRVTRSRSACSSSQALVLSQAFETIPSSAKRQRDRRPRLGLSTGRGRNCACDFVQGLRIDRVARDGLSGHVACLARGG
jgi:hypothetical protein